MTKAPQCLADLKDANEIEAIANDPHRRTIPGRIVRRLLDDEQPLKVWCEHRGLTRAQLAAKTGLIPGHVAQIQTGRRQGTADTLRRLATALDATVDDLVPIKPAVEEV